MNAKKDKWSKFLLNECCSFIRGVTYSNKDEVNINGHGILRANNIDLDNKINFNDIKLISSTLSIKEEKKLRKNDIFICTASGSVDHIGKVAFIDSDTDYYAGGFMGIIRAKSNIVIPYLLYNIFLSPVFVKLIKSQRAGTNIQNLKFSDIDKNEVYLPPIEEQIRIVSLFQSIETAFEKIEEQDKDLNSLQKVLCNGLLSKEPHFGKILNKKNCKHTNFGEVADCIEQHDKEKKNVKRFIGLENIESENLIISAWGDISKGTTFTKKFSKGDVLFGKRRAYLKKVAVADFDGICSGDILVIRAKENLILSELLPFYIMSEPFINHAVSTSAGSLSPRTKWKDLAKLEFAIPDIQTQKTILNVFKQIQLVLTQLKEQKHLLSNLKQNLLNEIFG